LSVVKHVQRTTSDRRSSEIQVILNSSYLSYARRGVLVLVAAFMSLVGLSAWWGLHETAGIPPQDAFAAAAAWQPWGGPAWIPAARRSLAVLPDPDRRERLLQRLGTRYPLSATLWLEQARTAHARNESTATVRRLLDTAIAVEPGSADVRWQAAMVAIQAGDLATAGNDLRDFVTLSPRKIDRAVLVARRWIPDPQRLLDTLVAPDNTEALKILLRYTANWRDWDLATSVWQRLPEPDAADPAVIRDYITRLLYAGLGLKAARVWSRAVVGFGPGEISNGDFTRPLEQRTLFDWRLNPSKGAAMDRDEKEFASAPAALHVRFDGKQNLRLNTPEQLVAVEPGHAYRLSGEWMARGLTTRALPYVHVIGYSRTKHYMELARIKAAGQGGWPWQAFTAKLTVPDDVEVIRVRLQRDPTGDFDRNIAGDLWMDDVSISEE
jgi:hypothetical protein